MDSEEEEETEQQPPPSSANNNKNNVSEQKDSDSSEGKEFKTAPSYWWDEICNHLFRIAVCKSPGFYGYSVIPPVQIRVNFSFIFASEILVRLSPAKLLQNSSVMLQLC